MIPSGSNVIGKQASSHDHGVGSFPTTQAPAAEPSPPPTW